MKSVYVSVLLNSKGGQLTLIKTITYHVSQSKLHSLILLIRSRMRFTYYVSHK
jgi:hypothetical protein